MLENLQVEYPENWIDTLIAEKIENVFKTHLGCEKIYYYYIACPAKKIDSPCYYCQTWKNDYKTGVPHPVVWIGKGLIRAIKKMQSREFYFRDIMATSAKTKSNINSDPNLWCGDEIVGDNPDKNTYWIGDVSSTSSVVCCDDAFAILWDRLNSRIKKKEGEVGSERLFSTIKHFTE